MSEEGREGSPGRGGQPLTCVSAVVAAVHASCALQHLDGAKPAGARGEPNKEPLALGDNVLPGTASRVPADDLRAAEGPVPPVTLRPPRLPPSQGRTGAASLSACRFAR